MEFYVAAASSEVQKDSEERGDWQALLDAGAIPLPPGCGPCIGLGKGLARSHEPDLIFFAAAGLLQDGEVGISATNRNFRGRMGSREAQVVDESRHDDSHAEGIPGVSSCCGYVGVGWLHQGSWLV